MTFRILAVVIAAPIVVAVAAVVLFLSFGADDSETDEPPPSSAVESEPTRTAAAPSPTEPTPTPMSIIGSPISKDLPAGQAGALAHSTGARIEIPRGATTDSITVSIAEIEPPDGSAEVGQVFDFSIGDAELIGPVTLHIPFELKPGESAEDIRALHWREDLRLWELLDGVVDAANRTVAVSVTELSLFSTRGLVEPCSHVYAEIKEAAVDRADYEEAVRIADTIDWSRVDLELQTTLGTDPCPYRILYLKARSQWQSGKTEESWRTYLSMLPEDAEPVYVRPLWQIGVVDYDTATAGAMQGLAMRDLAQLLPSGIDVYEYLDGIGFFDDWSQDGSGRLVLHPAHLGTGEAKSPKWDTPAIEVSGPSYPPSPGDLELLPEHVADDVAHHIARLNLTGDVHVTFYRMIITPSYRGAAEIAPDYMEFIWKLVALAAEPVGTAIGLTVDEVLRLGSWLVALGGQGELSESVGAPSGDTRLADVVIDARGCNGDHLFSNPGVEVLIKPDAVRALLRLGDAFVARIADDIRDADLGTVYDTGCMETGRHAYSRGGIHPEEMPVFVYQILLHGTDSEGRNVDAQYAMYLEETEPESADFLLDPRVPRSDDLGGRTWRTYFSAESVVELLPDDGLTIPERDTTPADDRAALTALYNATDGPNWKSNRNWLTDAPLGEWEGVTTDESGRVTGLDLSDNGLNGEIPPELGNLSNLQVLVLSSNQLSGEIPSELGNLYNLKVMYLIYNLLSGEIPPELGNLPNLEELSLGLNHLAGAIPAELGNLSNLQVLVLSSNQLSGEIPPELGNRANLERLYLAPNLLTGCVPMGLRDVEDNDFDELGLPFCTFAIPTATATPTPTPTRSPGNSESAGRIAFVSDRDGGFEIYVMDADGSNQTRLTDNEAVDQNPTWSPDGRSIAFVSDRDGDPEIYVMDADGSNQTRLTDNEAEDWFPMWSPDGRSIAFASDRDGDFEIYVIDADGSNQTRLTDNEAGDSHSSWSPDGRSIAFGSYRDGNTEIYVIDADGSNQTRLTDNEAEDWFSSWSPDGRSIAFASDRDGGFEIYVMDADGSNQTRLTDDEAAVYVPSWSPDGRSIAFVSERDGNLEIYVIDADGSNQTRLTDNEARDGNPTWSPDGRSIAFESDRDGNWEVYVMNADGSNQTRLTDNEGWDLDLSWSAGNASAAAPTVQPETSRQSFKLVWDTSSTFVEAGESFILSVRMYDVQQPGEHGGISVSFPSLTQAGGSMGQYSSPLADVEVLDYTNGLSQVTFHQPGATIHHSDHRRFPAEYLLVETDDPAWSRSDDKTLLLRITPQMAGELPILVRGWICAEGWSNCSRNPANGDATDQQGHGVEAVTVGVGPGTRDGSSAMGDRAALVALYNATGGPYWYRNRNWLTDAPLGEWEGVATDESGRVTGLTLADNRLSGEIPAELGNLANLEVLDLYLNLLDGEIPAELGNLTNLHRLTLAYNLLSGEIPAELGNLANLKWLQLSINELSGEIPPELGNLSNLETLDLDPNLLTGCVPMGLRDVRNNDFDELGLPFCTFATPAATTTPTPTSTHPPGNSESAGRIAFSSDRDGNQEIYVMNADGSDVARLTDNGAGNAFPSWSPDGRRIAFSSYRDGNLEIYVMNADGSDVARLTDNEAGDAFPSWSPDGRRIAFASERDGDREIYVMNADGSDVARLTDNEAEDVLPSWSPDGRRIAFNSYRDGNYDIYVMNGDGSDVARLTDNEAEDVHLSWSPDGRRIAFASDRDGNLEIYVMNADGSGVARLTDNEAEDMLPSWSPDGRRIAFNSYRDGNLEIYVMNADGSDVARLTDNEADDLFPSWSAESVSVAAPTVQPVTSRQ